MTLLDSILASGPIAVAQVVTEIGSYAGYAAILGLAVLSALYFSQARDLKRLRDWAGRAPERDAEARARVAAATAAGQARQQQPATPQSEQPAAETSGNSGGDAAAPAEVPAAAPGGATPAAATAAGASSAAGAPKTPSVPGGRTAVATPPARGLGRPSSATSLLGAQEPQRERWYRRIAPRYIALIVAGVLVVGGGIAVGVLQLVGGGDSGSLEPAAQTGAQPEQSGGALAPADVSVAVLNATGINGLANQFGDKAQAEGFQKDNVGNAPGGQRAESVVLYAPGREDAARLVRRRFDVSNIEPIDPESQGLAPDADVILIVGSDKTQ